MTAKNNYMQHIGGGDVSSKVEFFGLLQYLYDEHFAFLQSTENCTLGYTDIAMEMIALYHLFYVGTKYTYY
jgi:hypothetical protein